MNLKQLFVAVPTALCVLGNNWTANAGETPSTTARGPLHA